MTIRSLVPSDDTRQDAAANWVLRLQQDDVSQEVAAEWLNWCDADPRNREAFDRMAAMWELTASLDKAQERPSEWGAVVQLPMRKPITGSAVAVAASLLLLVLAAVLVVSLRPAGRGAVNLARYETPIGVTQAATLSDGSKIELGGRTSLSVRYSEDARMIVAEQGEAFFQVAKERDRPFVVQAGPLTATAVGTAFSLERTGDTIVVGVTEGIVEIQTTPNVGRAAAAAGPMSLRASAGERVRFDRGELVRTAGPFASADRWKEGRLEFRDEPLRLVVARINRYSDVQLEISDPAISDLRVTTTVDRQHIESWLKGIEMVLPIRVSRPADKVAVISPAA